MKGDVDVVVPHNHRALCISLLVRGDNLLVQRIARQLARSHCARGRCCPGIDKALDRRSKHLNRLFFVVVRSVRERHHIDFHERHRERAIPIKEEPICHSRHGDPGVRVDAGKSRQTCEFSLVDFFGVNRSSSSSHSFIFFQNKVCVSAQPCSEIHKRQIP